MNNHLKINDRSINRDRRYVEEWLVFYPQRRELYIKRRENIMFASPPRFTDEYIPRPIGSVSDTTGRKGTQLGDLMRDERWLQLVEDVENHLSNEMRLILRLRQESYNLKNTEKEGKYSSRPAWLDYVTKKYNSAVEADKKRQDRTLLECWYRIINYATIVSAKRGLLKK